MFDPLSYDQSQSHEIPIISAQERADEDGDNN
jgi:hypothetical protein